MNRIVPDVHVSSCVRMHAYTYTKQFFKRYSHFCFQTCHKNCICSLRKMVTERTIGLTQTWHILCTSSNQCISISALQYIWLNQRLGQITFCRLGSILKLLWQGCFGQCEASYHTPLKLPDFGALIRGFSPQHYVLLLRIIRCRCDSPVERR